MTALEKDREKIDDIDRQITELFEERFRVVQNVIDYKMKNGLPILNSGREETITAKNTGRIRDDRIRPYFQKWYAELLVLSKEYQKEIQDDRKKED